MLCRFRDSCYTSVSSSYDANLTLMKNKRIIRNQLRYSQVIGSLMYLASSMRLDIAFPVTKLSQFISNLGDDHFWKALERVMCSLARTVDYEIHYTGDPKVLDGYNESNWISNADEIKTRSGFLFKCGGGNVFRKSANHLNKVNNGSKTHSF